jgi:hypothetical protein
MVKKSRKNDWILPVILDSSDDAIYLSNEAV